LANVFSKTDFGASAPVTNLAISDYSGAGQTEHNKECSLDEPALHTTWTQIHVTIIE
jgi:hypothetical protein